MNNDIENQIKKLSCVAYTIIIGTFVFCGIVAYALCKSY